MLWDIFIYIEKERERERDVVNNVFISKCIRCIYNIVECKSSDFVLHKFGDGKKQLKFTN